MAYSFLIFDFGGNEEAAQQARHRVDAWKQGFRLDKKLQLKFDRQEPEEEPDAAPAVTTKTAKSGAKGKAKPHAKSKSGDDPNSKHGPEQDSAPDEASQIRLIVRLDFSDHEKLSHQRWLERVPNEEPFNTAKPKVIRVDDPEFKATSELFDSID